MIEYMFDSDFTDLRIAGLYVIPHLCSFIYMLRCIDENNHSIIVIVFFNARIIIGGSLNLLKDF